jgi:hypothetical protein
MHVVAGRGQMKGQCAQDLARGGVIGGKEAVDKNDALHENPEGNQSVKDVDRPGRGFIPV